MNVEEYIKIERYLKLKAKTFSELDEALRNLHSHDPKIRKKGEKRLSSNARRELGWNCLPVKEWFLNENNKAKI